MNIFDYFFRNFQYIINVLDHDFFGFGFSYLDFILALSISFIILKFLFQGFELYDKHGFLNLTGNFSDFYGSYNMSHNSRERQIFTTVTNFRPVDRNGERHGSIIHSQKSISDNKIDIVNIEDIF